VAPLWNSSPQMAFRSNQPIHYALVFTAQSAQHQDILRCDNFMALSAV